MTTTPLSLSSSMSSATRRKTPPSSLSAASSTSTLATLDSTLIKKDDTVPIDINIPDNYVEHTLKSTKPLPPITWDNWYKEINWLSFTILTVTPFIGIVGAYLVKLRWETFLFSIFYYYVTGLGEPSIADGYTRFLTRKKKRNHGRVPSLVGTSVLQRVEASSVLPRFGRCRCS